jgi:predicted RNA-binding protein associated with RNAse of E/G family
VSRCEIVEPEPVVGGRLVLPAGARSFGYFWLERPYVVYHWLVEGETFLHYVNLGRVVSLDATRIVWDDYAVDVLAWPDGTVEVVDEDEIPDTTEESILAFIAGAKAHVLAELPAIVESVERETRSLEAGRS